MDSDKLYSMYAEIVNGVDKKNSRYTKNTEASRLWDQIFKEVKDIKRKDANAQFDIPSEIPGI